MRVRGKAVGKMISNLPVKCQSFVKELWRNPEIGLLHAVEGIRQIEQSFGRGAFENANRTDGIEVARNGLTISFSLIDEYQVCVKLESKAQCFTLARMQLRYLLDRCRTLDFESRRPCSDEIADGLRP